METLPVRQFIKAPMVTEKSVPTLVESGPAMEMFTAPCKSFRAASRYLPSSLAMCLGFVALQMGAATRGDARLASGSDTAVGTRTSARTSRTFAFRNKRFSMAMLTWKRTWLNKDRSKPAPPEAQELLRAMKKHTKSAPSWAKRSWQNLANSWPARGLRPTSAATVSLITRRSTRPPRTWMAVAHERDLWVQADRELAILGMQAHEALEHAPKCPLGIGALHKAMAMVWRMATPDGLQQTQPQTDGRER